MVTARLLADRTAVLFLGVAAGAAIGYAFADGARETPVATPQAVAPPPPTAAAKPPEQPPELAAPFPERLLTTLVDGRPVKIGVFGDSFGDGVWSGLQRQLPKKDGFAVVKFSRQSTGFTRYRSLNLETHTAEQIAVEPVDIAVINYGANDTQGVIDEAGKFGKLMSPEWQAIVGKRIAGLVGVLRNEGATVYWVGLPRMRKDSFDADIAAMNSFYAAEMTKLKVPFIDIRSLTTDAQGGYAPYLPDETGKPILMRAEDGIHMSMTGYLRVTRGLAGRIRDYVAAARRFARVPPPAEPA